MVLKTILALLGIALGLLIGLAIVAVTIKTKRVMRGRR